MKKSLLLIAAGLIAVGANAQYAKHKSIMTDGSMRVNVSDDGTRIKNPEFARNFHASTANTGNKTTTQPADSTRWYSHADVMVTNNPNLTRQIFNLWFDSTVLVAYSNGLFPVNYASGAQVIDPTWPIYNDPGTYGAGTMGVGDNNSYRVDSIFFSGAYVERTDRPSGIIDTFVFSIAPHTQYYYWLTDSTSWAAGVTNADTLKAAAPDAGTVANAMQRIISHTDVISWKVPIDPTLREPDSAGFVTVKGFQYEVPGGGINIPAGSHVAVSVAFKSGDVVANPNADSIVQYHRFYLASYGNSSQKMPYTWYTLLDRNSSSSMFAATDDPWWIPTVVIEAIQTNPTSMATEFHDIAVRIRCTDCVDLNTLLGVNDVSNIKSASAFPNPAHTQVSVPFSVITNANVNVSVLNTVGQVLSVQSFSNVNSGTAVFNTANMANGLYFYTVESEGQKVSGRFIVAH